MLVWQIAENQECIRTNKREGEEEEHDFVAF